MVPLGHSWVDSCLTGKSSSDLMLTVTLCYRLSAHRKGAKAFVIAASQVRKKRNEGSSVMLSSLCTGIGCS